MLLHDATSKNTRKEIKAKQNKASTQAKHSKQSNKQKQRQQTQHKKATDLKTTDPQTCQQHKPQNKNKCITYC